MIELTNNEPDLAGLPVALDPTEISSVAAYGVLDSDDDDSETSGTVIGMKNGSEFFVTEPYDDVLQMIPLS